MNILTRSVLMTSVISVVAGLTGRGDAAIDTEFWRTDGATGGTWTSLNWNIGSANATGGTGWTGGNNATFNANSTLTYVTGTLFQDVTVANNASVTVTAAGTASANAHTYSIGTGATLTWTGQNFTASGTSFIKNGTGTWNIGSISNAYSGGFTLNDGTVIVTGANSLGAGALTINGGTIDSSSGVAHAATSLSLGGNFTLKGTGTDTFGMSTGIGSTTRIITNSTSSGSRTFSGAITGASNAGLTFNGSGTGVINLTGASANTYTGLSTFSGATVNLGKSATVDALAGNVLINGGVLNLVASDQINNNSSIEISSGTFGLATFNETLAGVKLNGGSITSTSGILTSNSAFDLQSGTSSAILNGSSGLNKTTGATATLSGASTYSGLTNITNGTLAYGVSNAIGAGDVTVNGGSAILSLGAFSDSVGTVTLDGGAQITGSGALTSTGSFEMKSGTAAAILAGGVALNKSTSGTITLSGANTYSGLTTISAGTLKLGAAGTAPNSPLGTTTGGTTVSTTGASLDLNGFTLATSEALTLNGSGVSNGGALTNTSGTAVTYNGLLALGSDASIVANGSISLANGGTITGSGYALTLDGSGGSSSVSSIVSTGTGTLTKQGSGQWTLNNSNTYTGLTTVSNGTLRYGTNNAIGSGGVTVDGASAVLHMGTGLTDTVGTVTVDNGGTITGSSSTVPTLTSTGSFEMKSGSASVILAGAAPLNKTTAGDFTLSAANTYSGGTTVSLGKLQLAKDSVGIVGNITSSAIGTGTLALNGGTLSSSDTTAKTILNPVTFGGDATLGDATNIGKLTFSAAGTLTGTRQITVASAVDYGGVIGQTNGSQFGLTKLGSGLLNLTNTNTYTGKTTVSDGTLQVSAASAIIGDVLINGGSLTYGSTTTDNIKSSSNVSMTSGTYALGARTQALNSLTMSGGTLSRGGTGNLTLSSGSTSSITGGTLNFTATDSDIRADGLLSLGGANFSYDNASTASAGFRIGNTVTYAASNTAAATFTNSIAPGVGRLNLNNGTRTFDIANAPNVAQEVQIGWNVENGGITKTGTGVLVLSGVNSYASGTTINNGTLVAKGAANSSVGATGSGTVTVTNSGVLAGSGVVKGAVVVGGDTQGTAGGTITAGDGAAATDARGALTIGGNTTFNGGGTYAFKINRTRDNAGAVLDSVSSAGVTWDLLTMPSLSLAATSGSKFTVKVLNNSGAALKFAKNELFEIAEITGAGTLPSDVTSRFALDVSGLSLNNADFQIVAGSGASGGGNDLFLQFTGNDTNSSPEPTTALLAGLGGAALLGRRRRLNVDRPRRSLISILWN